MYDLTFLESEKTTLKIKNKGDTILETALQNNFPLYHLCGGNARCTTCRVVVTNGLGNISERNERERTIADRKGWSDEIRLSCQSEIFGNIEVQRIIKDEIDLKNITAETKNSKTGEEIYAAILFLDIKGFTSFTESSLAYDVVFVLNRFFQEMSEPILNNGGFIDKFIGDGILAYFFLDKEKIKSTNISIEEAKKEMLLQSVRACFRISDKLRHFNQYMKERFHHEFDIRIGLHAGPVIYGEMGHVNYRTRTVLGDTVNVASRLESLNKKTGTSFLVSDEIYQLISDKLSVSKKFRTIIRGKTEPMTVYSVKNFQSNDTILELQRSIDLAVENNPNLANDFYSHFFETKPEYRKFFNETNLESQAKKILTMISYVVEKLGNRDAIPLELNQLGKMHTAMGIDSKDFSVIAPSLIWVLKNALLDHWTIELESKWKKALVEIASFMSANS